ncbi:MAG: hypothetical protein WCP20_23600 [Desulfuromonadales bacterium]
MTQQKRLWLLRGQTLAQLKQSLITSHEQRMLSAASLNGSSSCALKGTE